MKLNQPLNLEIQGEVAPYIKYPHEKYWSGVSLPMMSIGYEVKITPLQTLTFYNAIANNGTMVKPHFVKSLLRHGQPIETFGGEVICSSICSSSTLRQVREVLEGVVQQGTAQNLKNPPVQDCRKNRYRTDCKRKRWIRKEGKNELSGFVCWVLSGR